MTADEIPDDIILSVSNDTHDSTQTGLNFTNYNLSQFYNTPSNSSQSASRESECFTLISVI